MSIKITAADRNFSLAVRTQADWQCQHCGKQGGPHNDTAKMECAHLIGRRSAVTRWDMANAVCLCHTCHRDFTEQPKLFTDWVEAEQGKDHWQSLYIKHRTLVKNTKGNRDLVSRHYLTELKAKAADPEHVIRSWEWY